jgi:hypothetical protein
VRYVAATFPFFAPDFVVFEEDADFLFFTPDFVAFEERAAFSFTPDPFAFEGLEAFTFSAGGSSRPAGRGCPKVFS